LDDPKLKYSHIDTAVPFSKNYNIAIKMADTDNVVLIHNDMIIGPYFLENIEKHLNKNTIISYTTIEPPIFSGHQRPGKIIKNFGSGFDDFDYDGFLQYINENTSNCTVYDGAVFFMAAHKNVFENVGWFDDYSFFPAFAEDDDFLIRAKLKGYDLKTISCAISYHFVSQTSRFSDEFKNDRLQYEVNSNRNFIRKWGIPIPVFTEIKYWQYPDFKYEKIRTELILENPQYISVLEPFFDKIQINVDQTEYVINESKNTNYNISNKFTNTDQPVVSVHVYSNITQDDFEVIQRLPFIINGYEPGKYSVGNLIIEIH
jgi:hypothetical protein